MSFTHPHLRRELFGWHSPHLGMDMPIVRYGHWGPALLLFPSAQGDFLEPERYGLVKAIEHLIFAGRAQVFCINSINPLAWMNRHLDVREQGRRQALYSGYIEEEVVPHIRRCLQDGRARIAASGPSFGAFFAANAFFRRPDLFSCLLAMSGFYDLGPGYLHGYSDDNIYFNNPLSYLPNLQDEGVLHTLRHHSQIHILSGQGAYERPEFSRRLSHALWARGIGNNLDLWGHDMPHDWTTWQRMLDHYLSSRLGW